MIELFVLAVAAALVLGAVVALVALLGGVLEAIFHLAVLPFTLLGVLLEVIVGIVLGALLLAFGLPLLVLGAMVALPLLLVAGIVWAGVAVLA